MRATCLGALCGALALGGLTLATAVPQSRPASPPPTAPALSPASIQTIRIVQADDSTPVSDALRELMSDVLGRAGFVLSFDAGQPADAELTVDTGGDLQISFTAAPAWAPAGSTHHMGVRGSAGLRLVQRGKEVHAARFQVSNSCFVDPANKVAFSACLDEALTRGGLREALSIMLAQHWRPRHSLANILTLDAPGVRVPEGARPDIEAAFTQTLASPEAPMLIAAWARVLVSGSHWPRTAAGRLAESRREPRLVEAVVAHLEAAEPGVRFRAALALALLGDSRARAPLREALARGDEEARLAAAQHLGESGDRSLVPLMLAAADDPAPALRAAAITALGKLGDASVVDNLLPRLIEEPAPEVRGAVAFALGEVGAIQAKPTLLSIAASNADPRERAGAFSALGRFKAREAVKTLSEAALKGRSLDEQRAAIVALGRIGDPKAISPLKKILENDAWVRYYEESLRSAAAEALGEIGGKAAIAALGVELENASQDLRAVVARAKAAAASR